MHEGGITSVQFDPTNRTQVLTNSLDSSLKIVDIRTGTAMHTLQHQGFNTVHGWSRSSFSPDGNYVLGELVADTAVVLHCCATSWILTHGAFAVIIYLILPAGSNSTGDLFVWSTADGSLKVKLSGHKASVCGVDWGRGGSSGQQVASVDRTGTLILWA